MLTKPKWEKLPEIYKKLGTDYDQRVLPSIVNEVLKGVVVRAKDFLSYVGISSSPPLQSQARFNASQLITQRELVSGMIQDRLRERAADFFIDLDDVSIVRASAYLHVPSSLFLTNLLSRPPSISMPDSPQLRPRVYRCH